MNPVLFSIGSFSVMWYSALILIGVLVAMFLISKEGKRFGIDPDFLFNLCFYTIIFGFLGARIYYVIFNSSIYSGDFLAIFKIWEGGLAIHGGIIAGLITMLLYCKKHKVNFVKMADIAVPALFFGQAIGRWGNFFNSEAHGPATTLEFLQSINIPEFIIDGMLINGTYYQPTFFYESIVCLVGFLIVIVIRRFKFMKIGYLSSFYLIWYGIGRFFIESMRTDSLMLTGFKVAQIVSIVMIAIGIIIFINSSRKGKFEKIYNLKEV